jgi:hypothetical protein
MAFEKLKETIEAIREGFSKEENKTHRRLHAENGSFAVTSTDNNTPVNEPVTHSEDSNISVITQRSEQAA